MTAGEGEVRRGARADWLLVLPIGPLSRVLCVGREARELAEMMASSVGSVVAVTSLDDRIGGGVRGDWSPEIDLVLWQDEEDVGGLEALLAGRCPVTIRSDGCVTLALGRQWAGLRRWRALFERSGWGAVQAYWIQPDLKRCRWVLPLGVRGVTAACFRLLSRDRRALSRIRLRVLSGLVHARVPATALASTVLVVAERCAPGLR